jgi:hypothetical protein
MSRYTATTNSWSTPSLVLGGDFNSPKISMNATGDAIVAAKLGGYSASANPNAAYVRRYDHSSDTWAPSTGFGMMNGGTPSVAIDAAGNALLTFTRYISNDEAYAFRYTEADDTWTNLGAYGTCGGVGARRTAVAAGGTGQFSLAWYCDGQLNVVRYELGVGYTASGSTSAPSGALIADSDFNLTLLWKRGDGRLAVQRLLHANTNWSAVEAITPAALPAAYEWVSSVAPNGDILVAWEGTSGATSSLQSVRFSLSSNSWSSNEQIAILDSSIRTAAVALLSSGDAVAVWNTWNTGSGRLVSSEYSTTAGSWKSAVTVSAGDADNAQVSMTARGREVAVWMETTTSGMTSTDTVYSAAAGIPAKPTSLAGVPGNSQAAITWTAPDDQGASAVSGYTVTASPGGQQCTWTSGPLQCTVTGLTNGQSYTFTATATNTLGTSVTSASSASVFPRTVPNQPTAVSATPSNTQVLINWTAPGDNGGAAITGYTVTSSPEGRTCTWSIGPLQCSVTNLTNGTNYTFTVEAINAAGAGAPSSSTSAVAPRTIPGTPTDISGVASNNSVVVSWAAPASSGGATITSYTVTASPGGQQCTWSAGALQCTVSSLTNGSAYTFTVMATNAAGNGSSSAASSSVMPRTTPGVPTSVTAQAGNTQAQVNWTAPTDNGGVPITAYTVTSSPSGLQCAWTSGPLECVVSGLSNGQAYTFTVTATNAAGTSFSSGSSNSTTPRAVPGPPTGLTATYGNGRARIAWAAPASTGGSPVISYTVTAAPGGRTCSWTSGQLECTITGLTNGIAYSFTAVATNGTGDSYSSERSAAIIPRTTPGAPGSASASAGNASATISWTDATSDGGVVITSYVVTAVPGGQTCSWTSGAFNCSITGLTNGTAYVFHVVALNAEGAGTAAVSNSVLTSAVAGVAGSGAAGVTNLKATVMNDSTIRLTFKSPPGGSNTATCTGTNGKAVSASSTADAIKITGLAYGKSYTCDVAAKSGSATSAITTVRVNLFANLGKPFSLKAPARATIGSSIALSWKFGDGDEWAKTRTFSQLRTATGAVVHTSNARLRGTQTSTSLKIPGSAAAGTYSICAVVQDAQAPTNRGEACRKIRVDRPKPRPTAPSNDPKPVGPIGL